MEARKTKEADLERKKPYFFEIGLIIALLVVLVAFEYKNYDKITSLSVCLTRLFSICFPPQMPPHKEEGQLKVRLLIASVGGISQ